MSDRSHPIIAVVDDPRFEAHEDPGGRHPECPERLTAARSGLRSALEPDRMLRLTPRPAETGELEAVHAAGYIEGLAAALAQGSGRLDADTYFNAATREAAWLAAGSAAELARCLLRGEADQGLALLRPPGHHAEPSTPMGFCLLNNVAIAARAARRAGAERVAIVDWDVHHGNGTQTAFYDDPNVLFVSLHQYPFYPGTGAPEEVGAEAARGTTANVALPAGSGPEAYGEAFRRVVLPLLREFSPELLLVSAGFDAHAADPLAGMELDAQAFAAFATALTDLCPRTGFILEGGYDLGALEASVAAVTRCLQGEPVQLPEGRPSPTERTAIERTHAALSPLSAAVKAS
ncbi:MAG: histone deacetylase [Myxococcales bacterium]|nr:histone deacetylase [Myxococcales bacterium]MDD9968421.1 histone deacetylase [Myxococcales bacterium]